MKQLFTTYTMAITLKGKGFDEPCFRYFNSRNSSEHFSKDEETNNTKLASTLNHDWIALPTYQQVVDWFREKHFIYIHTSLDSYREPYKLVPQIQKMELTRSYVEFEKYYGHFDNTTKGNYEALEEAIKEALKLI